MKRIFSILAALSLMANVFAQAPEKMSYQAVIRNSSNALIVNQQIGMRISILQGSSNGTAVYVETQTPTTNDNGLVSVEIGGGNVVSGNFSTINWANGPYFIKTETDLNGGTNYTIIGTSQLLSVPYALHAKRAENITGTITETDPVFVASPANSITGTNITNWNTAYGWGNHANAGYLTTETDPVFAASPANSISGTNITNWNTAYGWGNHANAGYLTTEVDGSVTNEIQVLSISNDTLFLTNGGFVKLPTSTQGNTVFNGDSLVLKDSLGVTRMVLNPNTGTFKMMNNDTIWYEVQVASPVSKTEIVNKDGKVTKTYCDPNTGENVSEVIDFKTGITEITRTFSKVEVNNNVETSEIKSTTNIYKGGDLIEKIEKKRSKLSNDFSNFSNKNIF